MVSDAENALQKIATLILKEDDCSTEAAKIGAVSAGHVVANTIRLLIAGSQAGCLIGMSVQNIEKLRKSSEASVTILAPNQLPLRACAHESDRVVEISGDFPAVLKALAEIGYQLRENQPRQVVSISPAHDEPPRQVISSSKAHGNYLLRQAQYQPYEDPTSADYAKFEMVVLETFIGGVIGQDGVNISRIRIESGVTIKVCGGKGKQNVRHIRFSGTSQQVAIARQRVNECINSQMIQQAGTQQPGLPM